MGSEAKEDQARHFQKKCWGLNLMGSHTHTTHTPHTQHTQDNRKKKKEKKMKKATNIFQENAPP